MPGSSSNDVENAPRKDRRGSEGFQKLIEDLSRDEGASVITSGTNGTVADVTNTSSALLAGKITERVLLLHAVRSLYDAINLANKR